MLLALALRRRWPLVVAAASLTAILTPLAAAHAQANRLAPEHAAIVNGAGVSPQEFAERWPFIVALVSSHKASQYDAQFCGGSLVDARHVVTAAHCLAAPERPDVVLNPRSLGVVVGQRVLDERTMGTGVTRTRAVSDVFVHPDFAENAGGGYRYDVAVLRLAEPVEDARTIALAPAEDARPGAAIGWVAGWGNTDPVGDGRSGRAYPSALQQVRIPIHDDAACASSVRGGYGTPFERATNICGGVLQRSPKQLGQDTCQGDSGGPLIVPVSTGGYGLAGVTSWGDGCAQRFFGSYARMDALRPWLAAIPGVLDDAAPIGGAGNLHPVTSLRVVGRTFRTVQLAWDPPASGAAVERYGIWARNGMRSDSRDELVGITQGRWFSAPVRPSRSGTASIINVRAMDAQGNGGASLLVAAAPRADRVAPHAPKRVRVRGVRRTSAVLQWSGVVDAQSGVERYIIERRLHGRSVSTSATTLHRAATAWSTIEVAGAKRRSARLTLPPATRVMVRVRAVDAAGNAGRWSRPVTFNTPR